MVEAIPPLRLEWLEPSQLEDNPQNWRRHPDRQLRALEDVLGEVGWAGALLFNEQTGRLIDGHARKKVAKDGKVPVLIGSWSEEQEKKILATLDPLAAMAEADKSALDALLREVQTGSEAVGDMLTDLAARAGAIPNRLPTDPANDPNAEWEGMPEFEHEDLTAYRTINVHFKDEAAVRDFEDLVEQPLGERIKAIWYPRNDIGKEFDKEYVGE